ncbi:MAG: MBG domain-containing protein, partial [Oscillospiraceae bacterium]
IYTCEILAGGLTYFTPYLEVVINKRSVTLTSADAEKTYDGKPLTKKSVVVSDDRFASGEGAAYDVTGTITYVGETANTFSYTLKSNTAESDYDISCVEGTLKINAVGTEIIITADSDSREYDGTALTSSAFTYTEGILAEGDVLYADISGTVTHVGTAENKVTGWRVMRGDTDVTANYSFGTPISGTLEIIPAEITITAASDSREYNGTALTNSGWEMTHGAIAAGESISVSVTGSQLDVGSSANVAAVTVTSGSADDYNFTLIDGTLEIFSISTKIIITADPDTKQYDGTALTAGGFSFTEGVLISGDVLTAVISGTITNAGETANVVASYAVLRGTEDVTGNYTFAAPVDGKLTVTPVSIEVTTDSAEKEYDGTALTKHNYRITNGALVGSDKLSAAFTGEQTTVGTSDNTAEVSVSVGVADNYVISVVFGTLEVKPNSAPITITASDRTEIYSGKAVTQTAFTYTEGILAAGDTLSAVTEGSQTDVGECENRIVSYKVTNANGEDVTNCYTFADCVDGTITVTPKAVTITVSNALKKYGDSDPEFSGDVSGLCSDGDIGTITYVRTNSNEEVGKYSGVLTAQYTENANYAVNVVKLYSSSFDMFGAADGELYCFITGQSAEYDFESYEEKLEAIQNENSEYNKTLVRKFFSLNLADKHLTELCEAVYNVGSGGAFYSADDGIYSPADGIILDVKADFIYPSSEGLIYAADGRRFLYSDGKSADIGEYDGYRINWESENYFMLWSPDSEQFYFFCSTKR